MNSRITKGKNSVTQKPVSFIAPGQLAKDHGYGNKTSNVAYRSKRIAIVEEKSDGLCNHGITGGNSVHNIVLHFGEVKWVERNITEESSFFDILAMCKRFIDIYSVGFKVTDGDGRPLRNDKDYLGMLREQEDVENILVYLDVDETLQPLLLKLPEDNPSSVPVPRDSQMREVIMEDTNGIDDLMGAIGSGTGILVVVTIIQQYFETFEKEKLGTAPVEIGNLQKEIDVNLCYGLKKRLYKHSLDIRKASGFCDFHSFKQRSFFSLGDALAEERQGSVLDVERQVEAFFSKVKAIFKAG